MIQIKQLVFNPFGVNTYIVYDSDSLEAIVVDPGMISDREKAMFDKFIADNKLTLKKIVNTHLHLDHCFGDNYVRNKYNICIAAHNGDAQYGRSIGNQAMMFGISGVDSTPVEVDEILNEGDSLSLCDTKFEVLHVPGHSRGSIVLYCPSEKFAIVGDVIFRSGIGRTDLPGGSFETLINGINEKILSLPDDTTLLPGHDMPTTVAAERRNNRYLHN